MKKIKIRAQINKIENTKATERIEETRRWFFEKINKIDKTLARLIKKTQKTKSIKIREKTGDINKDFVKIRRIIREYYKQLHTNQITQMKWGNSQKHINYQNRKTLNGPITSKEI